jgi:UDP-glucose 4-epimerase
MAHYLVTGGAGFIGSHLVEQLTAAGHRIRVLDDLSTGDPHNLPKCVELIVASVTEPAAVQEALNEIDGCFHLAAIASVERTQQEWWRSHVVNLSGTVAVFEAAYRLQRRGQPIPIVYASSAAVYGNLDQVPISEACSTDPLSPYGVDKLGCEQHAVVAGQLFELPTVGLRLFNVYGPRQNPKSPYSGVISIFCDRLLHKKAIEIHGNGRQVRDFVYVKDVVQAFQAAMKAASSSSSAKVFNVCTGNGTTIFELGETIANLCDLPFQPLYKPGRAGDVRTSLGDPSNASKLLGFKAQTTLENGLAETLCSMRSTPSTGA